MASSILSPIRGAIQGIVPSIAETVTGVTSASNSNRRPPSPGLIAPGDVHQDMSSAHVLSRHNSSSSGRHFSGHVRSRSDISSRHHSRQSSAVEIDIGNLETDNPINQPTSQDNNTSNSRNDNMEFLGTITWVERSLPFILLLLAHIMWDHRLGILVFVGLFGTFFHVNSTIRKQVALKERRLHRVMAGMLLFLFANVFAIYYVFGSQNLHNCLMLLLPNFSNFDIWTVLWCVGITDFIVRFVTMCAKCLIILSPRKLFSFRKRGKYFLLTENVSQFYRMLLPVRIWYIYFTTYEAGGEYFAMLFTAVYFVFKARILVLKFGETVQSIKNLGIDTRYGRPLTKEMLVEIADACPICQEEMNDPIELNICKHVFCEECIGIWFDRERTCPMCRAKIAEDPQWRDGSTQSFIQFF